MSYLSSATNPDALGDITGPSDDDSGSVEEVPVQVYPPADVPHAEDRWQPPDHGSPFSSDSVGDGPTGGTMAERVYVAICEEPATQQTAYRQHIEDDSPFDS